MALYFKPPRGIIDYQNLEKCVEERLKFYKILHEISAVSIHSIEYLYEDSALDRAGHYTLRLAAVKNSGFLPTFIDYEIKVLKLRLDSYKNGKSLQTFLKVQLRHAKECLNDGLSGEKISQFFKAIIVIFTKMLSKSYRCHVFNEKHIESDKCIMFTLNVPFQYCTNLVAKREVNIRNGYAQISCEKWLDLLLAIFYTFMKIAINEMHYSKNVQIALADERIKTILSSVCVDNHVKINSGSTLLSKIDDESKFFPLCMQNLQNVLKRKHRLAHEERFNLSLFLKDIGMSLNDSIMYWKSEYTKEHSECAQCSHSWEKDEKRYIYSIRHMYGLEGSRRTYKTRSCGYFQTMSLNPRQEGGCPFKHFDDKKLHPLMSQHLNENTDNINDILMKRKDNPSYACQLFLDVFNINLSSNDSIAGCSSTNSVQCDIKISSPVQYFLMMKNL